MKRACIIAVLIILAALGAHTPGRSENRTNNSKGKIVIFQFKDTSKTDEFAYYSFIIPDSIAAELKNRTPFDVRTHAVTIPYSKADDSEKSKQEHILYLSRKGKELSADYTISGSFEVKNNKILIKSQLFHVESQKLSDIEGTSDEIGVLIFSLIDSVTEKINHELARMAKSKAGKTAPESEEPAATRSPFLPAYRAVEGMTLYGEHGSMNLKGPWSDLYRDADHYAAGIRYGLGNLESGKQSSFINHSAVSLSYHHFITLPDNMSSSLIVSGAVLGYAYEYPIIGNFHFIGEIALGLMFSTIRVYQQQSGNHGPQQPIDEQDSQDPLLRLALLAGYEMRPLVLYTGVAANRIFYTDEPMDYLSFIFSIGFRL